MPTLINTLHPLLITFIHDEHRGRHSIRCCGCKELHPLASNVDNTGCGTIILDNKVIYVRALTGWISATKPLPSETCILVNRDPDSKALASSGVLLKNIEAVMATATELFCRGNTRENQDATREPCPIT